MDRKGVLDKWIIEHISELRAEYLHQAVMFAVDEAGAVRVATHGRTLDEMEENWNEDAEIATHTSYFFSFCGDERPGG